MQKQSFYQIDSKNNIREWNIMVIDHGQAGAEIIVESGIMSGSMVLATTPIHMGKNIGKTNETTPYQQACLQAQSEIDKKITKGYQKDINFVTSSAINGAGIPAPMLANKYDPTLKQKGSKNLNKLKLIGKEVGLQPKFDGNRMVSHVTLNGTKLYTRTGKPFIPIPHIQDQLTACFKKIYNYVNEKYGVTEYFIDGELFTTVCSFNKLNGVIKKESKTKEDEELILKLNYHIYDVILPVGYRTRMKIIDYFKSTNLKVVDTKIVKAEENLLQSQLEKFLEEGHEGMMIRQLDFSYENKRTDQLLKCKIFEDDEFEIIGFKKSSEGETLGSIQFKMSDGKTFFAAYVGKDDEQLEIWNNQNKYLGMTMTVEFFGYSKPEEGGKPRFPKAKGQRVEQD